MKGESIFEGLKGFHPAVQCTAILVIGAVVCVIVWQVWKTIRES